MAISTGYGKQIGEKQAAAKRVAESYAAAQKKSKKRGFFSKILGGVGGKLLGGVITGALGLTGIGAPIGLALGNMLAKKGAHELTKNMAPKASSITGGGKYGYGEEEAQTLREGLMAQEENLDPFKGQGTFGKELLSSYVSAGMSGGLKGTLKDFGKPGTFVKEGEGLLGGGGLKGALEGGKAGFKEAFEGATTWGGEKEEGLGDVIPETQTDISSALTSGELGESSFLPDGGGALETLETAPTEALTEEGWSLYSKEGGLIPEYNIGGLVQAKPVTIADYFGMQGKSLGGSNKHSLAEMLGRK